MQWPEDLGPIASSVYFSTPEWVVRPRAEAVGLTRAMGRHASFGRWADVLRRGGLLAGTIARDVVVDQGVAEEALGR